MFNQTMIIVQVLSEGPLRPDLALSEVHDAITTGDCSGKITRVPTEVDGPTMAKLLIEQGSDPGFFGLDEQGQEVDH